jgi:uncharacterized repeat protein (TIGR02543 family)
VFSGWSGDLTGAANPLTFTVGARDYAVVANFAPRTYAVAVAVAPAGTGWVTGAGNYLAGSTANLTASADATHTFTGWTGDLTSAANPLSFVVNGDVNLTANFATTGFALTTAASGGGTVTPGGIYPAGTVVTLTATPDALYRFTGWSGDAAGTTANTAVTVDRAKFVQANFTGKTAQTISFASPGDHAATAPPFALSASASSGLPVSFSLLSGPAILTGNLVEVTGAGPVTIRADQSRRRVFSTGSADQPDLQRPRGRHAQISRAVPHAPARRHHPRGAALCPRKTLTAPTYENPFTVSLSCSRSPLRPSPASSTSPSVRSL